MFRWSAIHDSAASSFELPGAVACGDHEGIPAQSRHRCLEGRQRAQRGIEEQQTKNLAGQGLWFGSRLQAFREREQFDDLLARQVREIEKIVHGMLINASRSRSMCSS